MQNQSEIRKLSNDWVSTSLGELSEYITSGSRDWKKYYSSAGALFIRTQDINKNRLSLEKTARVDLPKKVEGKRTRVRKGDLLITITGANVGKVALVDNDIEEAYVSQSVALVRLKNKDLGRYVHHHLMVREGAHSYLETAAYGMGRPVLNLKNIREVPIRLAPQKQRGSIVAEIEKQFSRLDEAVTSLKRAKGNLKRYKAAVLKAAVEGKLTEEWRKQHPDVEHASELLKRILAERRRNWEEAELAKIRAKGKEPTDDIWRKKYTEPITPNVENLPILPEAWVYATIDQLSFVVRGASPRPAGDPKYFGGNIPWITVGDLTKDEKIFLHEASTNVTEEGKIVSRFIEAGTFLLTNSGATLGVPKITKIAGCINDGSVALLYLTEPIKIYLYYFFTTITKKLRLINQGAAQPNLNTTIVRNIVLPLPPENEHFAIVAYIEERLTIAIDRLSVVETNLNRIVRLRQSILRKAFTGELLFKE